MNRAYLVLPQLKVQAANAYTSNLVVGGAPVTAAYLFGHALGRAVQKSCSGVVLVHHSRQLLGETDNYGKFHPEQRKGASFTYGKTNKRDYSSKNPHALSLQPTASMHITVSLILEIEPLGDLGPVSDFLDDGRFAGGQIIGHGEALLEGSLDAAVNAVLSGYFVLDRSDIMQADLEAGIAPHQSLIQRLGSPDCDSWLSPTCVGFAAIAELSEKEGVRSGIDGIPLEHAYAEPLVGLVQYVSRHEYMETAPDKQDLIETVSDAAASEESGGAEFDFETWLAAQEAKAPAAAPLERLVWRHRWDGPGADIFLLHQTKPTVETHHELSNS